MEVIRVIPFFLKKTLKNHLIQTWLSYWKNGICKSYWKNHGDYGPMIELMSTSYDEWDDP